MLRRLFKFKQNLAVFQLTFGNTFQVNGKPIQHDYHHFSEVPATTPISEKMSKDMKKRGFSFVGPTICYAYMQSVGLVNDHLVSCDYR